MCVQVNVRGEWVDTVDDLCSVVPCEPLADSYYVICRGNQCLCVIDIEATLNAAGVQWRRLENGDYEVQ